VERTRAIAQQPAARAVAHRLELADDRERDLPRRLGAEIEPDRRVQPAIVVTGKLPRGARACAWPDRANRCSERATASAIAAAARSTSCWWCMITT